MRNIFLLALLIIVLVGGIALGYVIHDRSNIPFWRVANDEDVTDFQQGIKSTPVTTKQKPPTTIDQKPPIEKDNGIISNACGLNIQTTGGQFAPGNCAFKITAAGACGTPCVASYSRSIEMTDSNKSHIRELNLSSYNKSLKTGTYYIDAGKNLQDFAGYVTESNFVTRNIISGELTLTQSGNNMHVAFDLVFANNVHIKGSGNIPVVEESAL